MSPEDIHVLILEYVPLRDKKDFADVIKLKNSEVGDYRGLPGWTWCHYKNPSKGEAEGSGSGVVDVMAEARGQSDVRRSHKPRKAGGLLLEAERGKETDCPAEPPERASHAHIFTSARWHSF